MMVFGRLVDTQDIDEIIGELVAKPATNVRRFFIGVRFKPSIQEL